jgi:hypothetical protein
MLDFEREVHKCHKCKDDELLISVVRYFPVYSFGEIKPGMDFVVVGVNPSDQEYEGQDAPLNADPHNLVARSESQRGYFRKYLERGESLYPYFREISGFFDDQNRGFFGDAVKRKLGYDKSPWEKVGCFDLVKCPTRCSEGQWTWIGEKRRQTFIRNCEQYLRRQLEEYKPRNILAYGRDVGDWFEKYLKVECIEWEITKMKLNNNAVRLLFVTQRQGNKHSKPEVIWINRKILEMLNSE